MTKPNEDDIELPVELQKLIDSIGDERKKLLREKQYGANSEQVRQFIGNFMYPTFARTVKTLSVGMTDTYGLAASNTNELRKLRAFVVRKLRDLGVKIAPEEEAELPEASEELIDEMQQEYFTLGALLEKHLPGNEEVVKQYQKVGEMMRDVVDELLGVEDEEEPPADDPASDAPSEGETPPVQE